MTKTKINPYRKTYNIEIVDKINENGNTYVKLLHNPAFMGSINVESDEFKINGKEPAIYKNNSDYYLVEKDLDYVEVNLNWKKRLNIMQQNLGNAIFRHFIDASTDFEILNYKVNERGSYIDIKAKDLRFLTMNNLEEMTNYTINSNLIIKNTEDSIEIDGLGKIFYQGPNLSRTGEVSILFIRNVSKKEEYLRIYLIAGEYAYKYARNALNNLNNIKMYLGSNSLSEVFSDVKKLKSGLLDENLKLKEESKLEENLTNLNKNPNKDKSNLEDNLNKYEKKDEIPKLEKKLEVKDKTNLNTDKDKTIKEPTLITDSYNNLEEGNKDKNDKNKSIKSSEDKKIPNKEKKLDDLEDTDISNKKEISDNIEDTKVSDENKDLIDKDSSDKKEDEKDLKTQKTNTTNAKYNANKDLKNAVKMFKNYATNVNGINYIYKILTDINITELKAVSTELLRENDFVQIYGIKCLNKSKLMIFRSQNLNFNLKEIFDKLQKSYNFTGSGNLFTLNIECDTNDMKELMEIFLIEIRRALA